MARGRLRVYLGAAPGVGKTFAMLDEGHRRAERGTDVVVAVVETHGRVRTAQQVEGLEVVPRRTVRYRDTDFDELDLAAVLARRPGVALVDELAHTNIPGSGPHEKRWQDVEEILEAGIDVVTTVNVQHLESLNDVVERITGVPQREKVPDGVVRAADQIELVDMSPEALRRRMAHGNVYRPEKVDAALGNYFRVGNLTALRELALLWLADSVDTALDRYRAQHGIDDVWETKERIVVALTGGPEGETLIRRATRIASRSHGGEILAVHIVRGDGLTPVSSAALAEQRLLVESLGGSFQSIVGDDVPTAVLDFARAHNATQIVMGASRRPLWIAALTGPGTGQTVIRRSGPIDVHVVTHDFVGHGRSLPRVTRGLTRDRQLAGALLALVLVAGLTPLCAGLRGHLGLAGDMLLYLTGVVVVALVGGIWPALGAAVVSSVLLNYYFSPPLHTLRIRSAQDVLALVVFLLVAGLVSRVVDISARRAVEASRAGAEAETLTALAVDVLRGGTAIVAILDRIRETFGMSSAALLERETSAPDSRGGQAGAGSGSLRGHWRCIASTGDDPCLRPEDADGEVPVGDDRVLVLRGRTLAAADERLLGTLATQVSLAMRYRQLTAAAEQAAPLAATDRLRTALLAAVGHDLRTPLATATATVSSLRSTDVEWSPEDRQELLDSAAAALDRLAGIVSDVLDISRLQAGVLAVQERLVGLDEIVPLALEHAARGHEVTVEMPDGLPSVLADPGLLTRVVANLVDNALRHGPADTVPRVAASTHGDTVELRVIDRGPGIAEDRRAEAFQAFQRLGDRTTGNGAGVGLGLAIARGFTEAMHGSLGYEDTPGGGATLVIALPAAAERVAGPTGRAGDSDGSSDGSSDPGGRTAAEVDAAEAVRHGLPVASRIVAPAATRRPTAVETRGARRLGGRP